MLQKPRHSKVHQNHSSWRRWTCFCLILAYSCYMKSTKNMCVIFPDPSSGDSMRRWKWWISWLCYLNSQSTPTKFRTRTRLMIERYCADSQLLTKVLENRRNYQKVWVSRIIYITGISRHVSPERRVIYQILTMACLSTCASHRLTMKNLLWIMATMSSTWTLLKPFN